ncbi:hypothetical protein GOBAR_AA12101 [Gossypium barbadense]|uniref:Uncharacterized protein n=1 Tax=Gossypium barbadense TaxID=3634 RepID=A0A2P5XYV5_GOSBA|nr:hypothetical protein GOBAR_AA12101 [Gossypium barbadense]
MGTQYFVRDLFQITGMAIEIVSINMSTNQAADWIASRYKKDMCIDNSGNLVFILDKDGLPAPPENISTEGMKSVRWAAPSSVGHLNLGCNKKRITGTV